MPRIWRWGAAAVAAYLVIGVVSGQGLRLRPIYDGLAPPPSYNYVEPPADLADGNTQPLPGSSRIDFEDGASVGRTVATGDGQAIVVFPTDAIAPVDGVEQVRVAIRPLDPTGFPEAPEGTVISGNAYRVSARYVGGGGDPVELTDAITVVLSYPVHAETMLRHEDGGWLALETEIAEAALQLFADSDALGVFVAAGPPVEDDRPWIPYAAGALGVLAAAAGYLFGRRGGSKE